MRGHVTLSRRSNAAYNSATLAARARANRQSAIGRGASPTIMSPTDTTSVTATGSRAGLLISRLKRTTGNPSRLANARHRSGRQPGPHSVAPPTGRFSTGTGTTRSHHASSAVISLATYVRSSSCTCPSSWAASCHVSSFFKALEYCSQATHRPQLPDRVTSPVLAGSGRRFDPVHCARGSPAATAMSQSRLNPATLVTPSVRGTMWLS